MTDRYSTERKADETQGSQCYFIDFLYRDRVTTVRISRQGAAEPNMFMAGKSHIPFIGKFDYVDKYGRNINRTFNFFMDLGSAEIENELFKQAEIAFRSAYKRADEYFATDNE